MFACNSLTCYHFATAAASANLVKLADCHFFKIVALIQRYVKQYSLCKTLTFGYENRSCFEEILINLITACLPGVTMNLDQDAAIGCQAGNEFSVRQFFIAQFDALGLAGPEYIHFGTDPFGFQVAGN